MPGPMILPVCILVAVANAAAGDQTNDPPHEEGSMAATFELPRAAPEEARMSRERLDKVRDVVQEFIDEGRIQGAVVGVARRGKVVYFHAQGVADIETQAPLQPDAIFHMASSTKPILGVAAMMMIEEGKFSPSDPVEKYIPEFRDVKVAVFDAADSKQAKRNESGKYQLVDVHRPVTIHDLLTHTSGIAPLPSARGAKSKKREKREGYPDETLAT